MREVKVCSAGRMTKREHGSLLPASPASSTCSQPDSTDARISNTIVATYFHHSLPFACLRARSPTIFELGGV
jgi:hypothetical protein